MPEKELQTVEMFDWYDGIVLAVVRAGWVDGLFLAALLYWTQVKHLRVYALLPVSEAQAVRLREKAHNWSELGEEVGLLASKTDGDVLLVCVEDRGDRVVGETRVRASKIAPLVPSEASDALDDQRGCWLNVIGPLEVG